MLARCYDLAGTHFTFLDGGTVKMPSFVPLLTFWLFVFIVVVQHSPISASAEPSSSERAVWEEEETDWRLLKAENRQQYLDLWMTVLWVGRVSKLSLSQRQNYACHDRAESTRLQT